LRRETHNLCRRARMKTQAVGDADIESLHDRDARRS
jgi:hypothetical protein